MFSEVGIIGSQQYSTVRQYTRQMGSVLFETASAGVSLVFPVGHYATLLLIEKRCVTT